ncbi:MAG: TonB-dependent receptor [Chromatiales bacterium]|nr:TonB-dependent receptor [Chromatiales bacterium]
MTRWLTTCHFTFLVVTSLPPTLCEAQQTNDLTALSLEELADLEITSVSRRSQPLSQAAAAVFVIDAEDIRRSGATSLPEVFRMVPGMQVAQLGSSVWAVSARGFSGRLANKLLVLVDGRSVYTPAFSGVYWEQLDVILQDIERIEVIRGPGATLWGANAVNGVINIITRKAQKTMGGLVALTMDDDERSSGLLRYGSQLAPRTFGRAYLKYAEHNALITKSGVDETDGWDLTHGGFRLDSELPGGDRLSLQGSSYQAEFDQYANLPTTIGPTFSERSLTIAQGSGWHVCGRLEHPLTIASDFAVQICYDRFHRDEYAIGEQTLDTVDVDFQHHRRFGGWQELIWGIGFRNIKTRTHVSGATQIARDSISEQLVSSFIQDEVGLLEDQLRLTFGSKFEHNESTGWEIQPNLRLLWLIGQRTSVWGAISRAVRTPSLGERYVDVDITTIAPNNPPLNAPLPVLLNIQGNEAFDSEVLTAYEIGMRIEPSPTLALDFTLFYNVYKDVRTIERQELQISRDFSYLIQYARFDNKARGNIHGFEIAADWILQADWRVALAYSFAEADLETDRNSVDFSHKSTEDNLPRHQISLRSMMNLRPNIDFDLWLRYVDRSVALYLGALEFPSVAAYWDLDLRLAWRPHKGIELALVGQNLLDKSRPEGGQELLTVEDSLVERTLYGSLSFEF